MRTLREKNGLAALAQQVGLDAPLTLAQGLPSELLASRVLPLPCALKFSRPGAPRARLIESEDELRRLLRDLPVSEPLLLQECARGPLIGLAVVIDRDGTVVARLQQEALRTWPPAAGGSALAVTVAPDEELTRRAARLLVAAGYWGLAQLQFLSTDRGLALIDVNPRFYGSMSLALASGVNLAAAWHAVAVDGSRPPLRRYRTGVSYRRLQSDVGAALRGDPRVLLRKASTPSVGSVWARDDPLPSALLAGRAVIAHSRRVLRRPGASPAVSG